ncbi:MAG: type II toxin-antitoxin system PemK/MazF family toxin [Candidatus Gracilibacteria bacterium]|nr:type II toxin-antitoxin system PemK/MazF family toxin [Candidatus Gracilibacteria bacterium]MDQ7023490.1 type II toxin-antitoxin system PemK/MazF family toxin [Candidatus Gracilibacteria bacterium]
MKKNFNKWNKLKEELEESETDVYFNEGQIWWITIGLNLKNESCGKGDSFRRPVLILKKLSSKTFIGIPLSSKIKSGTWFVNYKQNGEELTALIYQIRMFDNIRFQRKIGEMDEKDFGTIKKRLKSLLNL